MKNKAVICTFLVMLAAFIVVLLLPRDMKSIEAENRAPYEMPAADFDKVKSGDFATETESFIGDSVGFRGAFTDLSKRFKTALGVKTEAGSIISTTKDIGTESMIKLTLLLEHNTIMEMFRRNEQSETAYTAVLNHYAEKLPEDITLYNMIIPTQLEFKEPIYKNLQDDQKEAIHQMYAAMDGRIKTVDAYADIKEHTDEYIYFRTDHHWTPLGAYYGYVAFMKAKGETPVNKDDFEKNQINKFLGFLYNRVDRPELAETPDTIEWFDVDKSKKIKTVMHKTDSKGKLTDYSGVMYDKTKANYSFFFTTDHPIVEMTNTELKDGKTIVVIKDSYANAFAPWLIKSYHKVILVDPRIYEGTFQTVLDTFKPDDVLVMNYIFTTNFLDYCEMLTNLYE